MGAKARGIIRTIIISMMMIAAVLFGIAIFGLTEQRYICRGVATSPAVSIVTPEKGELLLSTYAPFVQFLARLLRKDIVGEADVIFRSSQTGAIYENQIMFSGPAGARTYTDFNLRRQFQFSEETGQLTIAQAETVFQGACVPITR